MVGRHGRATIACPRPKSSEGYDDVHFFLSMSKGEMNDARVLTADRTGQFWLPAIGVLSTFTGLWAMLSQSWSVPYQFNLFVHPTISLLCGVWAFRTAARGHRLGAGLGAVTQKVKLGASASFIFACGSLILALGLPALLRAQPASALVAAVLVMAIAVDAHPRRPSFDLYLSTLPNAAREPVERIKPFALERPEPLDQTASCGKPGACHPAALEDHLKSAHNRSVMTPCFQQNLDFMVSEIGVENANLCAGCHHPQSLFDARLSYKDFKKKDNFSCVYCHMIDAVSFPEDRRRPAPRTFVPRRAKPAGQQHAQRKSRELAENVIEKKET